MTDKLEFKKADVNIAILLPKKISGSYITRTPKSILSYLIYNNKNYNLKLYTIEDEELFMIEDIVEDIIKDGFKNIVSILTLEGNRHITEAIRYKDVKVFIPTTTLDNELILNPKIFYGGINYQEQVNTLESFIEETPYQYSYIFESEGALSQKLNRFIKESREDIDAIFSITKSTNYESIFDKEKNLQEEKKNDNSTFNESIVFLNTSLLKSSIVMSQARYYETEPIRFLSTQINYHPLILTLSQFQDRKNLVIANSITEYNNELEDINKIFKNDIRYDWINYSTTIGVENLITKNDEERAFSLKFESQVIKYPIELYKPSIYNFVKISK